MVSGGKEGVYNYETMVNEPRFFRICFFDEINTDRFEEKQDLQNDKTLT